MTLQDKRLRRKIQNRCRKLWDEKDNKVPDIGQIFKDEEFEVKFLGYRISFGDCKVSFEAIDLNTELTYDVHLTEYIRGGPNYWYITRRKKQ